MSAMTDKNYYEVLGVSQDATTEEIRRRFGSETPIMLISAYDWSEIEADAREAGITGFISKPLFKSTLYHSLKQYAGHTEAEPDPSQQAVDLSGKRVLLAEDNELNWEIASELLSEFGLELEWAENGRICVDMIARSEPGTYKAVLMDIRMPVMNGFEATRAIRKLPRTDAASIPILALSANASAEDIASGREAGMNGHLTKPLDIPKLMEVLKDTFS